MFTGDLWFIISAILLAQILTQMLNKNRQIGNMGFAVILKRPETEDFTNAIIETRSFAQISACPDILIDNHVSDEADYQHTMTCLHMIS